MTVNELIDELSKYPEDKEVRIICTYDDCMSAGGAITEIYENDDHIELYNDEG